MAKFGLGKKSNLIGIAVYAFGEAYIDQFIGQLIGKFGISTDLAELALGYYLMKRKGIIGSVGTAMFTINLYNVVKGLAGGSFALLTPQTVSEGW